MLLFNKSIDNENQDFVKMLDKIRMFYLQNFGINYKNILQLLNDVITVSTDIYFINMLKKVSAQTIFVYNFEQKKRGMLSSIYQSSLNSSMTRIQISAVFWIEKKTYVSKIILILIIFTTSTFNGFWRGWKINLINSNFFKKIHKKISNCKKILKNRFEIFLWNFEISFDTQVILFNLAWLILIFFKNFTKKFQTF